MNLKEAIAAGRAVADAGRIEHCPELEEWLKRMAAKAGVPESEVPRAMVRVVDLSYDTFRKMVGEVKAESEAGRQEDLGRAGLVASTFDPDTGEPLFTIESIGSLPVNVVQALTRLASGQFNVGKSTASESSSSGSPSPTESLPESSGADSAPASSASC